LQDFEEKISHTFNISIMKISGFFGAKVEAECFVECSIPNAGDDGK
jgi:hypothetical protein